MGGAQTSTRARKKKMGVDGKEMDVGKKETGIDGKGMGMNGKGTGKDMKGTGTCRKGTCTNGKETGVNIRAGTYIRPSCLHFHIHAPHVHAFIMRSTYVITMWQNTWTR